MPWTFDVGIVLMALCPCSIGFESQIQNLWCFITVLEWNIMVILDSLQNRKDFSLLIRKGSSVVFGYHKIE